MKPINRTTPYIKHQKLRPEHWTTLHYLFGRQPIVIGTLAKRLGVHPDGIYRTLQPLIGQKLISRRKDAQVERKARVSLTLKGKWHVRFILPLLSDEFSSRLNRYEYVVDEAYKPKGNRLCNAIIVQIPTVKEETIESLGLNGKLALTYYPLRRRLEYNNIVRLWRLLDLSEVEFTAAPRRVYSFGMIEHMSEKKFSFKSMVNALRKINLLRYDVGFRPCGIKPENRISEHL